MKCCVCKQSPIIGLRYRCLRCFNKEFCQSCFFFARYSKGHKPTHPMQEYCLTSTSGENVRDFTRIICNKFRSKAYFSRKNLNTGFMPLHGMLIGDEILINAPYDTSFVDIQQAQEAAVQQAQLQQLYQQPAPLSQQLQPAHLQHQLPPQSQMLPQQQMNLMSSHMMTNGQTMLNNPLTATHSQQRIHTSNGMHEFKGDFQLHKNRQNESNLMISKNSTTQSKEPFYQNLGVNGDPLFASNSLPSPSQMFFNADLDRRAELEAIIGQLEEENR